MMFVFYKLSDPEYYLFQVSDCANIIFPRINRVLLYLNTVVLGISD
jgi:hypothetical protein